MFYEMPDNVLLQNTAIKPVDLTVILYVSVTLMSWN